MRDLEIHRGHQFLVKLDGGKSAMPYPYTPCEQAAVGTGNISPGEVQLVLPGVWELK